MSSTRPSPTSTFNFAAHAHAQWTRAADSLASIALSPTRARHAAMPLAVAARWLLVAVVLSSTVNPTTRPHASHWPATYAALELAAAALVRFVLVLAPSSSSSTPSSPFAWSSSLHAAARSVLCSVPLAVAAFTSNLLLALAPPVILGSTVLVASSLAIHWAVSSHQQAQGHESAKMPTTTTTATTLYLVGSLAGLALLLAAHYFDSPLQSLPTLALLICTFFFSLLLILGLSHPPPPSHKPLNNHTHTLPRHQTHPTHPTPTLTLASASLLLALCSQVISLSNPSPPPPPPANPSWQFPPLVAYFLLSLSSFALSVLFSPSHSHRLHPSSSVFINNPLLARGLPKGTRIAMTLWTIHQVITHVELSLSTCTRLVVALAGAVLSIAASARQSSATQHMFGILQRRRRSSLPTLRMRPLAAGNTPASFTPIDLDTSTAPMYDDSDGGGGTYDDSASDATTPTSPLYSPTATDHFAPSSLRPAPARSSSTSSISLTSVGSVAMLATVFVMSTAVIFTCMFPSPAAINIALHPLSVSLPPEALADSHPPPLTPTTDESEQMRVLITGGAGLIGSHLARALLLPNSSSVHVTVLDNLSSAGVHTLAPLFDGPRFAFVFGDTRNASDMQLAMRIARPRVVVHLAVPEPLPGGTCDAGCRADMLGGMHQVLASMGNARMVLVSSADVYGNLNVNVRVPDANPARTGAGQVRVVASIDVVNKKLDTIEKPPAAAVIEEPLGVTESTPPNPATMYASTLLAMESLVVAHARTHARAHWVLRVWPMYGAWPVPEPTDPSVLRWTGHGMGVGGVRKAYDWVHVLDVVEAVKAAVLRGAEAAGDDEQVEDEQEGWRVVNVGSGTLVDIQPASVANATAAATDAPPGVPANLNKAKRVLGYVPTFSFEPMPADPPTWQAHPEYAAMVEGLHSAPWLLPRGLLRATYEPMANDLPKLAAFVAQKASGGGKALKYPRVSIIPYQSQYRQLAENLLASLSTFGQTRNYFLFAIDPAAARDCLHWNVPCYNATHLAVADFSAAGELTLAESKDMWAQVSWVKPRLVRALLELGFEVHLSDTDISYVRDVWASYTEYLDEVGAQVGLMREFGDYVANTGNYVVRPTAAAKRAWAKYVAIGDADSTISDQSAFIDLVNSTSPTAAFCSSRPTCAALAHHSPPVVAIRDYSNPFGRLTPCPRLIDMCKPDLMYIHPICFGGIQPKISVMKQLGAWFMEDENGWSKGKGKGAWMCRDRDEVASGCVGIPKWVARGTKSGIGWEGAKTCWGSVARLTSREDNA
ncbi:hypothetical protein BCR44DRAFT_78278 [Catenaria anguillulae PL171]|uniref:NAD-dependent epimerase/dehydratase domain-containing protein n=1 Tax=Catenaria anguillulae PL171 TaxID=765915 RepID=A0A1Y2HFE0_9FUNG|nr:hypothetical protein BCR44DRAFT_78278 [Catenaria anguillulae PL171]